MPFQHKEPLLVSKRSYPSYLVWNALRLIILIPILNINKKYFFKIFLALRVKGHLDLLRLLRLYYFLVWMQLKYLRLRNVFLDLFRFIFFLATLYQIDRYCLSYLKIVRYCINYISYNIYAYYSCYILHDNIQ